MDWFLYHNGLRHERVKDPYPSSLTIYDLIVLGEFILGEYEVKPGYTRNFEKKKLMSNVRWFCIYFW